MKNTTIIIIGLMVLAAWLLSHGFYTCGGFTVAALLLCAMAVSD